MTTQNLLSTRVSNPEFDVELLCILHLSFQARFNTPLRTSAPILNSNDASHFKTIQGDLV